MDFKKDAYRVIKQGARINGVPYMKGSILYLNKNQAKHHLGRKNVALWVK